MEPVAESYRVSRRASTVLFGLLSGRNRVFWTMTHLSPRSGVPPKLLGYSTMGGFWEGVGKPIVEEWSTSCSSCIQSSTG